MRRSAVAAIVVLCGCYHPTAATGVPCAANGDCPDGQTCDTTQAPPVCVTMPGSASGIDAPIADAPPDAPPQCMVDSDCTSPTAPICDPTSLTCRGCNADSECTDGVCVEYSGACVADSDVLFLTPGGTDAGSCPRGAPCGTFAYAFTLVTSTVRTIRIGNGMYSEAVHLQTSSPGTQPQVVLSGESRDPSGATLTATSAPVFYFDLGTNVLLEGVTVQGGTTDGIRARSLTILSRLAVGSNSGNGVNADGVSLTIVDSTITGNALQGIYSAKGTVDLERDVVYKNTGGGVRVQQGPATIVNCIVAGNTPGASAFSSIGGIRLDNIGTGSRVDLDTVAYNQSTNGSGTSGVFINGGSIVLTSSILADNGAAGSAQYSGLAAVSHCLFEGGPTPQGMGNKSGSPAFKDLTNGDFHITSSSAAIDNAGTSTIDVDIDGDRRPYGAADDIGADEYHP